MIRLPRVHLAALAATALLAAVPVTTAGGVSLAADQAWSPRPTLHTYSDKLGAVTSATVHRPSKLPKAPSSFRSFIDRRLTALWRSDLRSDPACDGSVAGHVELYAKRKGKWRTFFGGEDIPPCARLIRVGFPSEVGVRKCMDGDQAVAYQHA